MSAGDNKGMFWDADAGRGYKSHTGDDNTIMVKERKPFSQLPVHYQCLIIT